MRALLLLPILPLSVSASAEVTDSKSDGEARTAPLPALRNGDEITDSSASAVCRDQIDKTREGRGLPKLRRGDSMSAEPLLIAAVDKRIGGCSVMVMRNNLSDIRPLPEYQDGPARLQPLH